MKTLLEWLEENRSNLINGTYSYATGGFVSRNGKRVSDINIYFTLDRYKVENGNISLITPYNQVKENKYLRECKGVKIDVYDVIKAFNVTCPALQHLIKKALCTGLRVHKTREQDLKDILDSAKRAVELNK